MNTRICLSFANSAAVYFMVLFTKSLKLYAQQCQHWRLSISEMVIWQGNLWIWPIHVYCRLPRTSSPGMHCSGVVWAVCSFTCYMSSTIVAHKFLLDVLLDSITYIDGTGGQHSHEHTLALFDTLGSTALWDDYGIIADILVCSEVPHLILSLPSSLYHSLLCMAFHTPTFINFLPPISSTK